MGNFQCYPVYPTHMFKVKNIDDSGREVSRGFIEVNKTDLVFYQKGHDPIRWPLMSLRRYGFDTHLFSFESGRRCATGPGLYAFRCKKAEHVFNLVRENAQHCGEEARSTSHTSADWQWTHPRSRPPSVNGSLPRSNGTIQHHSPISIRSTHSTPAVAPPVYQNGDVTTLSPNNLSPAVQYVNTADIPELELSPSPFSISVPQINTNGVAIQLDYDSSNYIDDTMVSYASLNHTCDEELRISRQVQQTVDRDENGNKPTEQDHESVDSDIKKLEETESNASEEDIVNGNIELGQELNRNANASTDESSSNDLPSDEHLTFTPTYTPTHSPTHSPTQSPSQSLTHSPTKGPMPNACTLPQAYYANLDTVGELPHHYNLAFYSDLRTPRSTTSRSSMGSEFTFEPNGTSSSRIPSEHSYANLDSLTAISPSTRHRTNSTPGSMVLQSPPMGRVNYIQLDLETLGSLPKRPSSATRISRSSSMTSSPPKTPSSIGAGEIGNRSDSYATIDFDRTNALASANSKSSLPPNSVPGRRTRHDSRTCVDGRATLS